jgi:hypothetical protein
LTNRACGYAKSMKYLIDLRLSDSIFLNVDPAEIKFYNLEPQRIYKNYWLKEKDFLQSLTSSFHDKDLFLKRLYLIPGEWDKSGALFCDYPTYQYMKELFEHNFDYLKTKRYQELIVRIENGEVLKHKDFKMRSKEDVIADYFERYIEIFKSMAERGYISNKNNPGLVAIGRNGELIKTSRGRHRLSIAQLLGIKTIMVKVEFIHPEWMMKHYKDDQLSVEVLQNALKDIQSEHRHCNSQNAGYRFSQKVTKNY